jgi:hypothetical protein
MRKVMPDGVPPSRALLVAELPVSGRARVCVRGGKLPLFGVEENADVWDQIVAKYDLRSRNLRELIGQGDQHADFAFAFGAPEGPRAFVSTIKLRQAGFTKTIDTEDSFRNALQSLIDHKLLPPAAT